MLETLKFSIDINAKAEYVWFVLWNTTHYNSWTSAFSEGGSFTHSDWKVGSNVQFVNAEYDGIYAKIIENISNQKMVFRHIGGVRNKIEQGADPIWENALEQYLLTTKNDKVILEVHLDSPSDYASFFNKTFPKALQKIKQQAEHFYIYVSAEINKPVAQVWEYYNAPEHIVNWNFADVSWHCPSSENDLRVGGGFNNTMAAKDGSFSFDFKSIYKKIDPYTYIMYTIVGDDREVHIYFEEKEGKTTIKIKFEAETENTLDLQEGGWQAILNNFKTYIENN